MEVTRRLGAFVRADEGQDLLEYALLVALIALVVVAAVDEAGERITAVFANIASVLAAAV